MSTRAIDVLVDALRANGLTVIERGGDRYTAQCPAHDDHTPSLSVSLRRDSDGALVHCHVGCEMRDVLDKIGLVDRDLFDDPRMRDALKPNADYRYTGGRVKHRRAASGGGKKMWQSGNMSDDSLFGVEHLRDDDQAVYLTEGEKAALALRALGCAAVATGGSQRDCDVTPLKGKEVLAVVDRDDAGRKWAERMRRQLDGIAATVQFLQCKADLASADVVEHIAAGYTLAELAPIECDHGEDRRPAGDDARADQQPDDDGVLHTAHLGMAVELARRHNRKLLHVHGIGWHYWDGTRWAADDTGAAQRAVYATLEAVWREAFKASPERRKEITRMVTQCETANGVLGVLTLARALPEFAATVRDLDADPWLLNCANGTLDLRTGELRDHDPADRITRITNAAYRPDTRSGEWTQFLARILPDADVRGYLQRVIGLSLLGEVNGDKQIAPIGYGDGANGKSTFRETICHTLGDYAGAADPSLLIMRRGDVHPTGQADLLGRRLVTTTETEQGARLDLALLKRLTGGDKLKARFMHKDFFEFTPSHLLLMFTNHKPVIDDDTEAVWRRIRVIPFTVTIPQHERDGDLGERLLAHADAVLTWVIDGWNTYQRGGPAEPPAVLLATGDYRHESDTIGGFINERCHTGGAQSSSTTGVLWRAFDKWCTDEGVTAKLGKREFSRELDRRGFQCDTATRGWRRHGICLRHNNDNDTTAT